MGCLPGALWLLAGGAYRDVAGEAPREEDAPGVREGVTALRVIAGILTGIPVETGIPLALGIAVGRLCTPALVAIGCRSDEGFAAFC